MNPDDTARSSFCVGVAFRLARIVERVSSLGWRHSERTLTPVVSSRCMSNWGILRTPSSSSYSPDVKKRTTSEPPEICNPAFFREPLPNGVVLGFLNRLNDARLSAMQVPAETVDSVQRVTVVPFGAWPSRVYAVGHLL